MRNEIRVSVLGATGSIGDSTLSIIQQGCSGGPVFRTVALTAQRNVEKLAAAARATGAEYAAVADISLYKDLKAALSGSGVEAGAGEAAILEAATRPADTVVSAITGAAALKPTLAAVRQGANIALANKESLVCAGTLLLEAARKHNARILPVDSEHNAIFQVLDRPGRVEKLILTASGGPFRTTSLAEMERATPEQAIAHPNWSMGSKISVDSATMMNKGLELIEAAYLFSVPESAIDVLIHPQSIIHSLVAYDDGSVLAQLGMPDMRTPISYALAWPHRMPVPGLERLDLAKIASLDFEAPEDARFPAISLARQSLQLGAWGPNVFNAVNEVAVDAFLHGGLGFMRISELVRDILNGFADGVHGSVSEPACFEDVVDLDRRARLAAHQRVAVLA